MKAVRLTGLVLVSLAAACGSAPGKRTTPGVANAELPYRVLRANGGGEVERAVFFSELSRHRAICLGESHSNPHHHWSQLHIIEQVASRFPASDGLGMEMFQQPFQGVLDDFGAGRIDQRAMLARSGWKDRWGFDYELYRPIIELAVKQSMALLALNAPKELTKKIARKGIAELSEGDRARLPEMVLDDAEHRAWFDAIMDGHPHDHHEKGQSKRPPPEEAKPDKEASASAERIYAAQVLWDESMADAAARWLAADPKRRLYILAGNGHCHRSAIGNRLKRRGVTGVVTVRPIIDDDQGNVAATLADPIVDYVFVMRAPKK